MISTACVPPPEGDYRLEFSPSEEGGASNDERNFARRRCSSRLVAGCSSWSGFGFDAAGPEMPRLRQVLALKEGMVLADVGAGKGQLTLALTGTVGPGGHVFSTEIDPDRLKALRAMLAEANLGNVTVVEAKSRDSGLPAGCCDAIVLRRVYHHLTDPSSINASLLHSLRPGGVLVIIDMPPPFSWLGGSWVSLRKS